MVHHDDGLVDPFRMVGPGQYSISLVSKGQIVDAGRKEQREPRSRWARVCRRRETLLRSRFKIFHRKSGTVTLSLAKHALHYSFSTVSRSSHTGW